MKKVLAIILAIVMIATTLPLVFASEEAIEPYKVITVTASLTENPVMKFVPDATKTYIVTSYAVSPVDPCVTIYDATCDEEVVFDDNKLYNFCAKYEFVEGHEYYFTLSTMSDEAESFDFALECTHMFVDGICVDCDKICNHEVDLNEFPACECGAVVDCGEIELGATLNADLDGVTPVWFSFTPDEDVSAVFFSNVSDGGYDACAAVYDSYGEVLESGDDFIDTDFVIFCDFAAGETYYLKADTFSGEHGIEISLVAAKHTTDAGEEHDVYLVSDSYGTCQDTIYTDGIFCDECDAYIFGHEENGTGSCYDENGDRFCEYCGKFIMPDILEIIFFLSDYIDLEILMKVVDLFTRVTDFFTRVSDFFKSFVPSFIPSFLPF